MTAREMYERICDAHMEDAEIVIKENSSTDFYGNRIPEDVSRASIRFYREGSKEYPKGFIAVI